MGTMLSNTFMDMKAPFLKDLCTLAETSIEKVGLLCSKCFDVRRILDRPNSHIRLELYIQTATLYKHAHFVPDLTFKSNQQPITSSLSRNTGHKSHDFAVYHSIGRDSFRRVYEERLLNRVHDKCAVGYACQSLENFVLRSFSKEGNVDNCLYGNFLNHNLNRTGDSSLDKTSPTLHVDQFRQLSSEHRRKKR